MNILRFYISPFLGFLFSFFLYGSSLMEESLPIYVVAEPLEAPLEKTTGNRIVIDENALARSQSFNLGELLKSLPAVNAVQTGGALGQTSLFLRGTNSNQTLILLDGVNLSDPSNPGNTPDFSFIDLSMVEKIEILKGPQSVLYGGKAIGGVIKITTRKDFSKKVFRQMTFGIGSLGERLASYNVGAKGKNLMYSLGASHYRSSGFSIRKGRNGQEGEKDGGEKVNFQGTIKYQPKTHSLFQLTGQFSRLKKDLDNFQDDPSSKKEQENILGSFQWKDRFYDENWEPSLKLSYHSTERVVLNFFPGVESNDEFKGENLKGSFDNIIILNENNFLKSGLDWEQERGLFEKSSQKSSNAFGAYLFHQYNPNELNVFWGGRFLGQENRDPKAVFKFAPSYSLKDSGFTFQGVVGNGVQFPTLYQTYSSLYGNKNLKPEESFSFEGGALFKQKSFEVGLNFFTQDLKNQITWDPKSERYQNILRSKIYGAELDSLIEIPFGKIQGNYVFSLAKNKDTGALLLRRPKHSGKLGLYFNPWKVIDIDLEAQFYGKSNDFSGTIPSRQLYHLGIGFGMVETLLVQVKIKNLLNSRKEEVVGFQGPGRTVFASLKMKY